jgi:hypothetical protein
MPTTVTETNIVTTFSQLSPGDIFGTASIGACMMINTNTAVNYLDLSTGVATGTIAPTTVVTKLKSVTITEN